MPTLTAIEVAFELLMTILPIIFASVKREVISGATPADAVKAAMDSDEIKAIIAEAKKFG